MSQTCRNKSGNTTSGGNISKLGASCCDEDYWLEARGEIEEIPGVIWMLKAISSCLMLAVFGRPGCAFPSLLARLSSRHLLVSLCHDCLVFTLLARERRQLTLMKLLHLLVRVGF